MATPPRKNAALVRRFLTDVVTGGDTDAVATLLTEDMVDHNLVFGDRQGQEGVTALGWRVLAADVDVTIDDEVATEEEVAIRGTVAGSHRESLMYLAPTGKSFEIAYVWFCRIEDDKIAEMWLLPDGLGLMQKLGAIPELPPNRSLTDPTEHQNYDTHHNEST